MVSRRFTEFRRKGKDKRPAVSLQMKVSLAQMGRLEDSRLVVIAKCGVYIQLIVTARPDPRTQF